MLGGSSLLVQGTFLGREIAKAVENRRLHAVRRDRLPGSGLLASLRHELSPQRLQQEAGHRLRAMKTTDSSGHKFDEQLGRSDSLGVSAGSRLCSPLWLLQLDRPQTV